MQNRQLRGLFGLVAIGAATAVGVTTHDAGFTALTFIGALLVPRILGIGGRHRHGFGCGARGEGGPGGRNHMRDRFEQRLEFLAQPGPWRVGRRPGRVQHARRRLTALRAGTSAVPARSQSQV